MDFYKTAVVICLFCCLAACGKKEAEQPKKDTPAPGLQVTGDNAAGSGAAASEFPPAPPQVQQSAPAEYVKDLASDAEKAKAARKALEIVEQERLKAIQQANSGN